MRPCAWFCAWHKFPCPLSADPRKNEMKFIDASRVVLLYDHPEYYEVLYPFQRGCRSQRQSRL
jgi:hypothetical protein